MSFFDISFPDSPAARGLYVAIILVNALVSYRLPSSLQGLLMTILIYTLLLTGSVTSHHLALLVSVARLSLLLTPAQVPLSSMLVTYALSFLLCWILYKLSMSVDNQHLLMLFNVKLADPPRIYLRILDHNAAYIGWDHQPDRTLVGYDFEINHTIVGHAEPHEKAIALCQLAPNTTYRLRLWANSRTRGRSPSSFLMFRTLEALSGSLDFHDDDKEIPIDDQIRRLEIDLTQLQTSRQSMKEESDQLLLQDHSHLKDQLNDMKVELKSYEELLTYRQKKLDALKIEKNRLVQTKNQVEQAADEKAAHLARLESTLKSRLLEIEADEKARIELPLEMEALQKRHQEDKFRWEREIQTLESKNQVLEKSLDLGVKELKTLQDQLDEEEAKLANAQAELVEARKDVEQLGPSVYEDLVRFCELSSRLSSLKSDKESLNTQLRDMSSRKVSLMNTLAGLNSQISSTPPPSIQPAPLTPWGRSASPENITPTPTFGAISAPPGFPALPPSRQTSFEEVSSWPRLSPLSQPNSLRLSPRESIVAPKSSSIFSSPSLSSWAPPTPWKPDPSPWASTPVWTPGHANRSSLSGTLPSPPSSILPATPYSEENGLIQSEDDSDQLFRELFQSIPNLCPPNSVSSSKSRNSLFSQ